MSTYGKGTNCDKLWRAWHGILICALHIFLIYVGIVRYLSFKYEAFDPKFGGDWDQSGLNFTLAMLISAIALFSLFLFVNLTRTVNYANEGVQVGRDTNNLNLLSSTQSWRPSIPMMTIKGNGFQRPVPQMLSNGESEDDRMSTMGEEDALPGPNFDTWSGRSLPNQDHPYAAVGTARYPQSVTETSMRTSLHLLCNRLQRHMLPYSSVLHLTAAFCFILPISIMHAQQISHRALPSGELLTDWSEFLRSAKGTIRL
ncbi:hypothetical protein PHET_04542 [Paragonimus heterotremus]|uniref:Uncharacterized protein n=1 Tax=Paragonimus heterotremus TaxID=100268 RepID=A0A8J4SZA7_9TREM|nr:hypothetical protein PHET_04542 [Paragonimus heterotremus]